MNMDKAAVLAELAKGNQVDLEKIAKVERQLAELQRAGIAPQSGCKVTSPLGNPVSFEPRRVLANAAAARSPR